MTSCPKDLSWSFALACSVLLLVELVLLPVQGSGDKPLPGPVPRRLGRVWVTQ